MCGDAGVESSNDDFKRLRLQLTIFSLKSIALGNLLSGLDLLFLLKQSR